MYFKMLAAFIAGALLALSAPATAQTSVGPIAEDQILIASVENADPSPVEKELFSPSLYGIVEFDEPTDLYGRLTEPGRCQKMAPEKQPCAFIFYERISGAGKTIQFKPVFKVESPTVIWVMHDQRLKKVSVENLYNDKVTVRGQTAGYHSFGVVGNAENSGNCASGRGCLKQLVEENMFLMYSKIPELVVDKLWRNKMTDNGTRVVR